MFECHITVNKPKTPFKISCLEKLGKKYGWATSMIDGDPVMGDKVFFYFTRYSNNLNKILNEMAEFSNLIPERVVRQKVEQIVYDSRLKNAISKTPFVQK